ncbi:MAG TPA: flippase [Flavobacteriales bacterium]|nr:flippase [Flavobacteriales bacterium]
MLRSEGFQRYFRNTSWLFIDRVVRLVSVLVTSIFVTRFLGPELFGELNYASAFVGMFFALTSMGMEDIITRDLVRHPERRDTLLGSAAMFKLGGSVILFIAVLGIALLKGMSSFKVLLVALIACAEFLKPFSVIEPFFHSRTQGRIVAQVNIVQSIAISLFRIGVIMVASSPQDAMVPLAMAYIVEMGAISGSYLVAYRSQGLHWRAWRFDTAVAMDLLRQSWPLIVFGIALYVQAKIDQVIIGDVLRGQLGERGADAEVGQYSAALKMIEALGFLPSIVAASLAPAITRAHMQDRALFERRVTDQYRLMFLLFLVTAVPLYFLAPPFMILFFGEEFSTAGQLLSLFAIRLFFTNMGVAKTAFITNEGLFRYSMVTAVIGAACNITLNLLLIPSMHAKGAIWAMIISFFISNFLLDLFYREARPNFAWTMRAIGTFWRVRHAAA